MAQTKFASRTNLVALLKAVKGWVDSVSTAVGDYFSGGKLKASALPAPTATTLGGVKAGANITIATDGTISTAANPTKVSQLTNDSGYQTAAQVKTAAETAANTIKAQLIDGAPETMDTLKEVSDALAANNDVVEALNAAIGNKAAKATTLAGYGITDAKIANGVITLGTNTITPLTTHQSLDACVKTADLVEFTEAEITAIIADAQK